MKPTAVAVLLAIAAFRPPVAGQATRDFLTADEIDQVRLTQEPNARLKLYSTFARLRADMLTQMVAREKPGRSAFIHATLEDYTRIIEAIDTVADDALKRNLDITEGIKAVAEVEKQLLASLKKIEESEPSDLARYRFALTNAIEATEDSLQLAEEDLAERRREVNAQALEEQKKREALMTPTEVQTRRAAEQKRAEEEQKQQRKAPTLRRKGGPFEKKP
jgi:hypothetical protein